MSLPTSSYLYHDPNHILNTQPPFQSPLNSPDRVLAVVNKSPAHGSSRTNSVRSWLSKASPQASENSPSNSNNPARLPQPPAPNSWQGLAISPTSPQADIEQQRHQPFIPNSQTLETVAELEGTAITRPVYELPGDTESHPTSRYRPYRPSVGSGSIRNS
ncbi:hypothetical protein VMCG_01046 [Cytospora schulzeri]|uniref:Uncharacterized protein n=1 Tax=Cytospora schulzeri TaxID=448051 RepID=A0A423X6F8_9PEZI|nr:hypothetical protein VMCG_01046 [Valsa malicola]